MRLTIFLLAIVVMAALAGCNEASNGSPSEPGLETAEPTYSGSMSISPVVRPVSLNESFAASLDLTDCRGFKATIPGATETFDFPPTPPGWDSDNPVTGFDLRFYECDRVSWGTFERGPIQMLVEMGGDFQNPESCSGENATLLRNMASWWFSDADLAAFASQAYGVNAYATMFSIDRTEQDGFVDQTWSWGDVGARSNARLVDADTASGPTTHVTRIFWFVGEGVYAMDWSEEWQFPIGSMQGLEFRPVTGRLEDPMLFSSTSDFNDFVGQADRYEGMNVAASFYRFGDLSCEQPF